ncbi:MAG: peptidase M23 [Verrucomicrobia bacterium]|nr:MAG: peptidase M23 [Verrucomicrobiota bacterium]
MCDSTRPGGDMTAKLRLLIAGFLALPIVAAGQGLTIGTIDQALGRSGQKSGDVYRVAFPRTDLHVSVNGIDIKPGLALGSWAAFTGSDENTMVMGDLVLLEDELNAVMDKLRAASFEITAVHNHLLHETPHVLYMHYMGHGPSAQLAAALKTALSVSKTPLDKPAASAEDTAPPAWVNAVQEGVGRKGAFKSGVLSYGVARSDQITMDGKPVAPAQGLAEAINFQAAGTNQVATTGDFVLTAAEVNPVLSELRSHNIYVTALHSHMLTEEPRLFFMHFWAVGDPQTVGAGIKAALSRVAVK